MSLKPNSVTINPDGRLKCGDVKTMCLIWTRGEVTTQCTFMLEGKI